MIQFDPDPLRAASHRNAIENTSGPLRAGAAERVLAWAGSSVRVTSETREPLVLIAAVGPLARDVVLTAALGGGRPASFGTINFAARTERGAALPVHRPPVDPATRITGPFTLAFTAALLHGDGSVARVLSAAEIRAAFEVRLLEGAFGRVLYLLGAEKARMRREAAQIAAMRMLDGAEREALDRIGRELGVPRFTDVLRYDTVTKHIVAGLGRHGAPVMEPDDDYRRRLRIYRGFRQSTRPAVLDALNGPGTELDPNAGLLAGMGVTKRFTVDEDDESLAVTIRLVESGAPAFRANFLAYVRANALIWPESSAPADAAHGGRFISRAMRDDVEALRARLRAAYVFPAGTALAPALAASLDRFASLRRLLGGAGKPTIVRAQDATAGSRFELGLGVALTAPSAAELDALAAHAADPHRVPFPAELEALLHGATPKNAASDPDGAWLLARAGLQTVHRVDPATLYLSHLSVLGLVVDGPAQVAPGVDASFDARYEAPGDPGGNAALVAGVNAALARWTGAGHVGWTRLADGAAQTALNGVPNRPAAAPALGIFRAVGLAAIEQPAPFVAQLQQIPAAYRTTLQLDPALSAAVVAGHADAITALHDLVALLRDAGLSSVLPLLDAANNVLLVVAVIGLPFAGLNLNERRASGFRWYVIPLAGHGGTIRGVGSHTVYRADGPGLVAIVTIGYARSGRTDPYEWRVDLPAGAALTIAQYEFLMNLLQAACPAGVMVNTFPIRSKHVDLDGDGVPDPLLPAQARTYRQFRRDRYRGEAAIGLDASDLPLV